ncbi:hypothetical protein YPPY10_1812, partial [Yersinia pestis PY-10]
MPQQNECRDNLFNE